MFSMTGSSAPVELLVRIADLMLLVYSFNFHERGFSCDSSERRTTIPIRMPRNYLAFRKRMVHYAAARRGDNSGYTRLYHSSINHILGRRALNRRICLAAR
jgi:hypothetical protein